MPRPPRKKTVLVASLDPQLADVRKQVLEEAGYRVITAKTTVKVRTVCQRQQVDLVMIGYSLPLAEKLRVRNEVRQHCKGVPVLLLYEAAEAELTQEGAEAELLKDVPHLHQSRTPRDFLQVVKQILGD
jgi:DNA-binding response OmpR family regulator